MTALDDLNGGDSGRVGRTPPARAVGELAEGSGRQVGPTALDAEPPVGRVVFRDLIIFQIKLFLDGVGDLILAPLSLFAFALDLIPGRRMGGLFYRVLRFGERWDRWLSLYRPAHEAGGTEEGLLGAGQIDADTFLGKVEEVVGTKRRRFRSGRDTHRDA